MRKSKGVKRRETKSQRFERLAERRVNRLVHQFRLIGNLANYHNYEYTDAHVRQILDALETELRQLKHKFRQLEARGEHTFAFRK